MPAHSQGRSSVPDLIYSDYRHERTKEVLDHREGPWEALPLQWRRLTVFATYRCNLGCVYCKTTRQDPEREYPATDQEYDLVRFSRLLERLSARPLRHVHFTGGEATLVRDLPRMVKMASRLGAVCSTTSNGVGAPGVYERLVQAGIAEIRVSFDSHNPAEFDRIVQHPGAYRRVVNNLEKLVRLRDRNGGVPFLILNVCVGMDTRRRLAELVKACLAFGANDVKLIPMVQAKDALALFPERDEVLTEIEDLLSRFSADAFPLLRHKLQSVFSPESLGLKDLASRQLMKHCIVPLAERTLDTTYYYPCSVYLREGGKPLGRIDQDDLETQQRKIAEFAAGSSCRHDPICRDYCISCCKQFNLVANAALRKAVCEIDGTERPIDCEVTVEADVSTDKLRELRKEIERRRAFHPVGAAPAPFLVIKPSGMGLKTYILRELKREGLEVVEEKTVTDWNRSAPAIYCTNMTDAELRRSLVLAAALPRLEGSRSAIMVILNSSASLPVLQRFKARIRGIFPPKRCLIHSGNDVAVTALNLIHVPETERCELEYRLLSEDI